MLKCFSLIHKPVLTGLALSVLTALGAYAQNQPTTPITARQDYRSENLFLGFGIARAQAAYGDYAKGLGVSIGDVEESFNPWHNEFRNNDGSARVRDVTRTKGVTPEQVPMCTRYYVSSANQRSLAACESGFQHGTAVMGILGAKDDGIGITGIVPKANLLFASTAMVAPAGKAFSAGKPRKPGIAQSVARHPCHDRCA